MDLRCAPLILVIIQGHFLLPLQVLQDASDEHEERKYNLSHRPWKRELQCDKGEYNTGTHCCKNCREGSHVTTDCEQTHGNPKCDDCLDGTYMDKENGYKKCHRCQDCQLASGQEMLRRCTTIQNTVCQCAKGFFCEEGLSSPDGGCSQCRHCTECDTGVAEHCTPMKDTVCSQPRHHTLLWIALGVYGVIVVALLIICCRIGKTPKEEDEQNETPKEEDKENEMLLSLSPQGLILPQDLEDIDLENYLCEIADRMESNDVLRLARKRLTGAKVEEIQNDYSNTNEQKYQLLKAWYGQNGRKGAFKYLVHNCNRLTAEALIKLVGGENTEQ